jgi:LPPG:FO 2-phospho-L-lactate transferase
MRESDRSYAVLSGGVGGAKLVLGLHHVLASQQLQVIANTGDDFEHLGLSICPDIDTLIYTLAGIANPDAGWGLANETWNCMEQLELIGGESWFRLGDRDIATHLQRGELLSSGASLSRATAQLCEAHGVRVKLHPMSDEPVRTVVHSTEGPMEFQEYFVRRQAKPVATGFEYAGHSTALAAEGALQALQADHLGAIIITPSNPWLSIDPILSLSDIRSAIASATAPVIAVSPIVGGRAIKGPTAKLMKEIGIDVSVLGIAGHYRDIVDGLIIDIEDSAHRAAIEAMGMQVEITNTIMRTLEDKSALATTVLRFAAELRDGDRA